LLERRAYGDFFPEPLIRDYADWYIERRSGWDDDWWLMEHMDFYRYMHDKGYWTKERDFTKIPTRGVAKLITAYDVLPKGSARLKFRYEHPELENYFVNVLGYKPVGDRWPPGQGGTSEQKQTPFEEAAEALAIREWIQEQNK